MADASKYHPIGAGNLSSDLVSVFSIIKIRRTTLAFASGFMLAFVLFTALLAFSHSSNASSPGFANIFASSTAAPSTVGSYKSQLNSFFSYFFSNSSSSQYPRKISRSGLTAPQSPYTPKATLVNNQTQTAQKSSKDKVASKNQTTISSQNPQVAGSQKAKLQAKSPPIVNKAPPVVKDQTQSAVKSDEGKNLKANRTANASSSPKVSVPPPARTVPASPNQKLSSAGKTDSPAKANSENGVSQKGGLPSNHTSSPAKKQSNGTNAGVKNHFIESMMKCDLFDGEWMKDDSYPLYKPGSCNLVDEQFGCIQNGRPDEDYQKYRWKPKKCYIPRLDGPRMLDLLRGKRLAFVGDSLNRNMWESLICILRNSVKDRSKVYEANGRSTFRGETSYSFIFKDYNFSVELFVSPFLVQEWEMPHENGTKKQTLRLDLVGRSADHYKDADIIIFNTGHWWTHEKTSKGKDYYQEGSHVFDELNVLEAFRRAITTWSRWVDANINPSKSMVFFRGYSASHFSGGQWNSGGQCDSETTPIKNGEYLREYPPKMRTLENVLKYMKTHVTYLNITRMTDFRRDGHPSIYIFRKENLSPEERNSPMKIQDCSHWCLPGVPDAWNEILYAELLVRQYRNQQQQKKI